MDPDRINSIDDLFTQLEYEERQIRNRASAALNPRKNRGSGDSGKDEENEEEEEEEEEDDGAGVISRMPSGYNPLIPKRTSKPINVLYKKTADGDHIDLEDAEGDKFGKSGNTIEESLERFDKLAIEGNYEMMFGLLLDKTTIHKGDNMKIFNLIYSKPWQLCSKPKQEKFLKIQTVRKLTTFLRGQVMIPWQRRRPRVILYFIRELEHFGFFTCHVKTELLKAHTNQEFVEIVLLVRRLTGHFENAIVTVLGFYLIPIPKKKGPENKEDTEKNKAVIEKNGKLIDKKPSTVDIMYRHASFANFYMDVQKVSYDIQARSTGDKK